MTGMIIIGAGECGARAAFALRELGYAGSVTLVGDEAHLPYERPPLSKEALHRAETPEPKWIGLAGQVRRARHRLPDRKKRHGDRPGRQAGGAFRRLDACL